ncbi:MAG: hypothetical protein ACHQ9S_12930 [Candidatus Binatia bacterium]
METLEPYTKHRPLTELTDRVSPQNVARLERILAALDAGQRARLNLTEIDGQPYLNHWYILIAAKSA